MSLILRTLEHINQPNNIVQLYQRPELIDDLKKSVKNWNELLTMIKTKDTFLFHTEIVDNVTHSFV